MSENSLDRNFREKIGYYSAQPKNDLWKGIEADLDQKKDRRTMLFYKRIAAVLLPLIGFVVGYYILRSENTMVENPINITEPVSVKTEKNKEQNTGTSSNMDKEKAYTIKKPKKQKSASNTVISKEERHMKLPADTLTDLRQLIAISSVQNRKFTPEKDSNNYLASLEPLYAPPSEEDMYQHFIKVLDESENTRELEILLGASAGPQYSSGIMKDLAASNNVAISNNGILAYAGGMNVQVKPWRKLSIEAGIYYSRHGNNTELSAPMTALRQENVTISNSPENNSDWYLLENSLTVDAPLEYDGASEANTVDVTLQEFNIDEAYVLLEIPLFFKYKLIDRKLGLNMIYGLSALHEISRSTNKDDNLIIVDNTREASKQNMNLGNSFGLGLDVPFKENFVFNVEPMMKYYFNNTKSVLHKEGDSYALSVMMGLKYRF